MRRDPNTFPMVPGLYHQCKNPGLGVPILDFENAGSPGFIAGASLLSSKLPSVWPAIITDPETTIAAQVRLSNLLLGCCCSVQKRVRTPPLGYHHMSEYFLFTYNHRHIYMPQMVSLAESNTSQ